MMVVAPSKDIAFGKKHLNNWLTLRRLLIVFTGNHKLFLGAAPDNNNNNNNICIAPLKIKFARGALQSKRTQMYK
jgi:hypothetical protein